MTLEEKLAEQIDRDERLFQSLKAFPTFKLQLLERSLQLKRRSKTEDNLLKSVLTFMRTYDIERI